MRVSLLFLYPPERMTSRSNHFVSQWETTISTRTVPHFGLQHERHIRSSALHQEYLGGGTRYRRFDKSNMRLCRVTTALPRDLCQTDHHLSGILNDCRKLMEPSVFKYLPSGGIFPADLARKSGWPRPLTKVGRLFFTLMSRK